MQTINAIFDGNYFKPIEPIPVKGQYEVLITFTKPIDTKSTKRQRILKYFGSWDDEDVKTMAVLPAMLRFPLRFSFR
jgi:hypothetical protein